MTKRKSKSRRKTTKSSTIEESTERRVSEESATDEEVKRQAEEALTTPFVPEVDEEDKPSVPSYADGDRAVMSAHAGRLVVPNAPSGERYVWNRAGEMVLVAEEDIEFIMSMNRNKAGQCCGSGNRTLFEFAV